MISMQMAVPTITPKAQYKTIELIIDYPSLYFQWIPAEKAIFIALKSIKVTRPSLRRIAEYFFKALFLGRNLAATNRHAPVSISANRRKSMMLQLLRNSEESYISLILSGIVDSFSENKGVL